MIKEKLAQGFKFSITTDDYTKRNQPKRNACVNLHLEGEHHRVALIQIYGSHPAKKGVELLEKKCKELDIKVKSDLITICTDGPQVMIKMGKMLGILHTLCQGMILDMMSAKC